MAEIPKWFPRTLEELHRPEPGEQPSIRDPRIATSHGGGVCPVQHWGVLVDGRVFYFRYRHGHATVTLGPSWYEPGFLPVMNPLVTNEMWDTAYAAALAAAGGDYTAIPDGALPYRWLGPTGGHSVTDEDDGWFDSQFELDAAFSACLDEVWHEPFEVEGWEALRHTDWRKEQAF